MVNTTLHSRSLSLGSVAARRHRGVAIFYSFFAVVAVIAFISLAVDFGRVQLAKTELRRAADAAARYACSGISDGTAITKAISAAGQNNVDGAALVLQDADVRVGTWSAGTFTSGGTSPNAVRIKAERSAARGNPVPLLFGQIIGRGTCDVRVTAIAIQPPVPFGVVGLDFISMTG